MARFAFEFDPLLRYRRYRRGHVRQLLAGLLGDLATEDANRAALVDQTERTLDELREIGRVGAVDVQAAAARRFHVGTIRVRIGEVDQRRAFVERQIELCRAALVEADRDVRVLERLRERRLDEFRLAADRREQRELEEAWTGVRIGMEANGETTT